MTKFFLDTNAFYLLAGVTSYKKFSIWNDKLLVDTKSTLVFINSLFLYPLLKQLIFLINVNNLWYNGNVREKEVIYE